MLHINRKKKIIRDVVNSVYTKLTLVRLGKQTLETSSQV